MSLVIIQIVLLSSVSIVLLVTLQLTTMDVISIEMTVVITKTMNNILHIINKDVYSVKNWEQDVYLQLKLEKYS